MNKTVSLLIRTALPIGGLALLLMLPMTDSLFGGRRIAGDRPVYAKIGDADGDGFVTLADAEAIRAIARGGEACDSTRLRVSDLNGDGQVTAEDAGLLLKYLADEPAGMSPQAYAAYLKGTEG